MLTGRHGSIATPAFVPAGPHSVERRLTPTDIAGVGAAALMVSLYDLTLRSGVDVVASLGGLHRFQGWSGIVIAESGARAIFGSISARSSSTGDTEGAVLRARPPLRRVRLDGLEYVSHVDGSARVLTARGAIVDQERLGVDGMCALADLSGAASPSRARAAVDRSLTWGRDALEARTRSDVWLFGCAVGGTFPDLRHASAAGVASLPFDGFTVDGLPSAPTPLRAELVGVATSALPDDKPRIIVAAELGDLPALAALGCDIVASDAPARLAEAGVVYGASGRLQLLDDAYGDDFRPIHDGCGCAVCVTFTRAYLHHLFVAGELLAPRLAAIHNLAFACNLARAARDAIEAGCLADLCAAVRA